MSQSQFARRYGRTRWMVWALLALVAVLAMRVYLTHAEPGWSGPGGSDAHSGGSSAASQPKAESWRWRIKVLDRGGKRYLFGGLEGEHFDIEQFRLDPAQLRYGLGREAFPALIEPQFEPAAEADQWLRAADRVLAVKIGDEVRVYPRSLLERHEVVNDVVGGKSIFVAYCILADLGAVYERTLGEHTYTFGVSGYTYAAANVWEGRQAFILWDRDTESLWWPPLGKAVSGPAIDMPMRVLDESKWVQSYWSRVKADHPDAVVLRRNQKPDIPQPWPDKFDLTAAGDVEAPSAQTKHIAPRWGANSRFD